MLKGIKIKINHTNHCLLDTKIKINNGKKKRKANIEFWIKPSASRLSQPAKPPVNAGLNINKYNLPNKEEKINELITAAINE